MGREASGGIGKAPEHLDILRGRRITRHVNFAGPAAHIPMPLEAAELLRL
jgi:hypothetical protein